jgi:iron(II)-dependent oxidoreductase
MSLLATRLTTPLATRLADARNRTDALFEVLDPKALYDRPVAERHRLIFYVGHLEAFDWNLLALYALSKPSFHPAFDKLFAFGIDPEPGRAPSDHPSDWPVERQVRDYVAHVRDELDRAVSLVPDQLLEVAIEHRLMHAETLAYLFHQLPYDSKRGPAPRVSGYRPVANGMVDVPAGTAMLGLSHGESFGWDNEFEAHRVQVPAFRISRFKISNGQYLEYVRQGAVPPHFWTERDGGWFLRTMFAEIPLPLDWPVYATQAEASAYARWRGAELPTEAQIHRASEGARPVNVNFERWDPVSVNAPGGDSRYGVAQLLGNGWEWTSTTFGPFPGFEAFPFYAGYSADFFDGKHYVMKGGSPRTAECMLRPSFRNWFRADYPYCYAGFRCVENR